MLVWNKNNTLSKPAGVGETGVSASASVGVGGLILLGLAGYGLYWLIKRN